MKKARYAYRLGQSDAACGRRLLDVPRAARGVLRVRRFDAMHKNLGISRNILADRLKRLVRYGILRKRRYQDGPPRYEYRLTEKGLDLYGVSVAMMVWGTSG